MLCFLLPIVVISACEDKPGGTFGVCANNDDCIEGYRCVEANCFPVCTDTSDCTDGTVCLDGVCRQALESDSDLESSDKEEIDGSESEHSDFPAEKEQEPDFEKPECSTATDCPLGSICIETHCMTGCLEDAHCQAGLRCNRTALPGTCVACLVDTDCTSSDKRRCNTQTNACVACLTNTDCTQSATPLCGKDFRCQAPCQDECSLGELQCAVPPLQEQTEEPSELPLHTYLICGDWDSDPCLEFSTEILSCRTPMVCKDDLCVCPSDECEEGALRCDETQDDVFWHCDRVKQGGCSYLSWRSNQCPAPLSCKNGECVHTQ